MPLFVGTGSATYAPVGEIRTIVASSQVSLTWVANLAVYVPLWLPAPYPVGRLWWQNGTTVTGNVDMGIYTAGGTLLANATTTAQSGASGPQYVSKTILLPAGRYYLGLACSGTTAAILGSSALTGAQLCLGGVLQQSLGSASLPSTMTGVATTNALYPFCGITQTASGF